MYHMFFIHLSSVEREGQANSVTQFLYGYINIIGPLKMKL